VLDPGTYYLNPYEFTVVEVSLQSKRFEMSGDDAINFLTLDGFDVRVEGTIEWAVRRESAAELTHRVGDMEDILKKVILPRARGFSRIEGSKSPAINYIVGETRQKFQDNLDTHLREQCAIWGVLIKSVLIRNIAAPDQIASVIREREVAVQDAKKFEQQIEQARSQAELTKQEMLAEQNREKVQAETARIRAVILANQEQSVKLLEVAKQLEVARLENDAATAQAQAQRLTAQAEQEVIRLRNQAEASVVADQVRALGNGLNVARHELYLKIAPRIQSILTNDDPQGLAGWLRASAPAPSAPAAPAAPAAPTALEARP
jgi:regulator of protease activity HflC (stomatin/prohibitin superfamily)